jgi:hypothetical protein
MMPLDWLDALLTTEEAGLIETLGETLGETLLTVRLWLTETLTDDDTDDTVLDDCLCTLETILLVDGAMLDGPLDALTIELRTLWTLLGTLLDGLLGLMLDDGLLVDDEVGNALLDASDEGLVIEERLESGVMELTRELTADPIDDNKLDAMLDAMLDSEELEADKDDCGPDVNHTFLRGL